MLCPGDGEQPCQCGALTINNRARCNRCRKRSHERSIRVPCECGRLKGPRAAMCIHCRRAETSRKYSIPLPAPPEPATAAQPAPLPGRTVVVNGIEFESVWDGRASLTGAWPPGYGSART